MKDESPREDRAESAEKDVGAGTAQRDTRTAEAQTTEGGAAPRDRERAFPPLLDELRRRGLLDQFTPGLDEILARGERLTVYCGFDPTAPSLHVGSLRPILGLAWFQRYGHRPIALVGGGTGRIGDPSGKTVERKLLSYEEIATNVAGIRGQLARFLSFDDGPSGALMLDNAEWLASWPLIDFLRDIGKHFRVGAMLGKESVRLRLGAVGAGAVGQAGSRRERGSPLDAAARAGGAASPPPTRDGGAESEGMSFTEFSYMLLQAADFLHLFRVHGCTLQIGGSDQWGNITAGIDLIRRLEGKPAHALTFPLVTTASGVKFGKTEAGAVWLDPSLTSPYDFYQFFVRTDDRDVIPYLKSMTFVDLAEIDELAVRHAAAPEKREAHHRLAFEVTKLVHGEQAAIEARRAAEQLFGARKGDTASHVEGAPTLTVALEDLRAGVPLADLLTRGALCKSKGEARRLVAGGGVYLNEERVTDPQRTLGSADLRPDGTILLRTGKKNYLVVRVE